MDIALIEVNEEDLEGLKIPFTIYAIYKGGNAAKVKALYLELGAKRKEISELYKKIEAVKIEEHEQE